MTTVAVIIWICVGLFTIWQFVPDESKNPDTEKENDQ